MTETCSPNVVGVSDQNKVDKSGRPEIEHTNVNSAEMVTDARTAAENNPNSEKTSAEAAVEKVDAHGDQVNGATSKKSVVENFIVEVSKKVGVTGCELKMNWGRDY